MNTVKDKTYFISLFDQFLKVTAPFFLISNHGKTETFLLKNLILLFFHTKGPCKF